MVLFELQNVSLNNPRGGPGSSFGADSSIGGVATTARSEDTSDREAEIAALKTLVKNQRLLLEKQNEYLEDLRKEQELFSDQVAGRIEETEAKVGSKISKTVSALNSKIIGPSSSDFKYKSSTENIARLNKLREFVLSAFSEMELNFGTGFDQLSGAKTLEEVLEEIDDQEEYQNSRSLSIRLQAGGGLQRSETGLQIHKRQE